MITVNTTRTPTILALELLATRLSPPKTLREVSQFQGWETLDSAAQGGYQYLSDPAAAAVLVVFDRLPYEGSEDDQHGLWIWAHTGVVYP